MPGGLISSLQFGLISITVFMRYTPLLILAFAAACATAPDGTAPRSGAANTVQRQNTSVAYSGGVDGNVAFNTQAALETKS